jgi:rhodanese-related sulfurtransferase
MPDTCGGSSSDAPAAGTEMSPREVAAVLGGGTADLVDVRTGAEFRASHVRGARHVSLDTLTPETVRAGRAPGSTGPVLLVCKAGPRARMAAAKLRAAGIECVVVAGGTDACAGAGLPMEADASAPRVWPIERQVRLVAGLLVLAGAALGYSVHPLGFALAAFVGAGLTFAGLTDFCGMALLLGRCPWNR